MDRKEYIPSYLQDASLSSKMQKPSNQNAFYSSQRQNKRQLVNDKGIAEKDIKKDDTNTSNQYITKATNNKFENDGSFMEKFNALQNEQQEKERQCTTASSLKPKLDENDQPNNYSKSSTYKDSSNKHSTNGGREINGNGSNDNTKLNSNQSAADLLKQKLKGKGGLAKKIEAQEDTGGKRNQQDSNIEAMPLIGLDGKIAQGVLGRMSNKQQLQKRIDNAKQGKYEKEIPKEDEGIGSMYKKAKFGEEAVDIDQLYADTIAASAKYRETDLDADAEYDIPTNDDGLPIFKKQQTQSQKFQTQILEQQKEQETQQRQHKKLKRIQDTCELCHSSENFSHYLVIAIARFCYLMIVPRGRLNEGHCRIVPMDHVASTRQVDDECWTEIRNFKKCLIQMFAKEGQQCLFLETAMQVKSMTVHGFMDCIPVKSSAFAKAPIYFKKAMDDAESEWSQHHAKRVIDTSSKGLRGSIPEGFPYLNVDFGISKGFVHVIDDEKKFNGDLGRQVVVSLLKLPEEVLHQKQRSEGVQRQQQLQEEFRSRFGPFDWTKQLDE